jgi:hypothetical protein
VVEVALCGAPLQAVVSLLNSEGLCGIASQLALRHRAVCHFAQAAKLAGFIHKADLVEAAARHAWNSCQELLLATGLTQASIIPQLRTIAAALNAARPADCSFQVMTWLLQKLPHFSPSSAAERSKTLVRIFYTIPAWQLCQ